MIRRLVVAAAALLPAAAVAGGVHEVQIRVPVPEKIDTTGLNRLLVGGFRSGDHPTVDLNAELNASLRGVFEKTARFEVLDVDPLPMPEQPVEQAVRNTGYWKRLGKRFNADLIVGGTLEFTSRDQSGFLQEDVISEVTGQRLRRSRWVERESFHMDLGVYFFRGATGELLYEDHFTEETVFGGKSNDDLSILHELIERVSGGILGILTPRTRVETRYLLTE